MLPARNKIFARYVEPAQARAEPWRTGLGISVFVILVFALSFLINIFGFVLFENSHPGGWEMLIQETKLQLSKRSVLFNLGLIVLNLPLLWLMLWLVHKRMPGTLIGPAGRIGWRVLAIVFVIFTVAWTIMFLPSLFSGRAAQQTNLSVWLIWLLPTMVLVFLQAMTEELIFRGYLLQQFSVAFRSKWVWWLGPAILFGALHYNPAIYGVNAWLVVLTAVIFGLILADITIRTGNLTIAIAIHFTSNFFNILVFGMPGVLSNLSLYIRPDNLQNIDETRASLLISIGITLVAYLIYLLVMRRRR